MEFRLKEVREEMGLTQEELAEKADVSRTIISGVKWTDKHGVTRWIEYDSAVMLMDDDIRERLHGELAPCTDQEFIDAYTIAHREEYGTDWEYM